MKSPVPQDDRWQCGGRWRWLKRWRVCGGGCGWAVWRWQCIRWCTASELLLCEDVLACELNVVFSRGAGLGNACKNLLDNCEVVVELGEEGFCGVRELGLESVRGELTADCFQKGGCRRGGGGGAVMARRWRWLRLRL